MKKFYVLWVSTKISFHIKFGKFEGSNFQSKKLTKLILFTENFETFICVEFC